MERIRTSFHAFVDRLRECWTSFHNSLVPVKVIVLLCIISPIIVVSPLISIVKRIEHQDSVGTIIMNVLDDRSHLHYMNKTETRKLINFLTDIVLFDQCPREQTKNGMVILNNQVQIHCNKRFKPLALTMYSINIRQPTITYLYQALVKVA